MVDAIAVDPGQDPPFDPSVRMPRPLELARTCASLISIVEARTKVPGQTTDHHQFDLQLAHFSVQTYLRSDRVTENYNSSLDELNARKTITNVCLAYVLHVKEEVFGPNEATVHSATPYHPCDELQVKADENMYPFFKYCARNWMQHAEHAIDDESLAQEVLKFLTNHRTAFAMCLRFHPNWNDMGKTYSNMPLYYASCLGLINIARLLIENGANVNAAGGCVRSALQAACWNSDEEMVELLLNAGANIGVKFRSSGNPLDSACFHGRKDIVNVLLKHGSKRNTWAKRSRLLLRALKTAAQNGYHDIVSSILAHGADADVWTDKPDILCRALTLAVVYDRHDIVKTLLAYGAVADAVGNNGTLVEDACDINNLEMAKALLEFGANVNGQGRDDPGLLDACGQIVEFGGPLLKASLKGHTEVLGLLLENGADASIVSKRFGSALIAASSAGHPGVVNVLLEQRVDVNTTGGSAGSAFHGAVLHDHENIAKVLLESRAEVNTAVDIAVEEIREVRKLYYNDQRRSYAKAALESRYGEYRWGLMVHNPNSECCTPLQLACFMGYTSIAKVLLEHGADVNVYATGGVFGSPIEDALKVRDEGLIQMIRRAASQANGKDGRGEHIVSIDDGDAGEDIQAATDSSEQMQGLVEHGKQETITMSSEPDDSDLYGVSDVENIES